jgi:hypothetical protein
MRARFHLPYNRKYGFGGEFPLKLLFIDDLVGRGDPRGLDDRPVVAVTTDTFEERTKALRPEEEAAMRARWQRLRTVTAAVQAAQPAAVIHLWNASEDDLHGDFEDAGEIARCGLYKLVDLAVYNWCSAASPPYSGLVFGYPLRGELLSRSVAMISERTCTPVVTAEDAVTMAKDIERTSWTLDPYGSDPRAAQFAAWSLMRYLFMLHCHYGARREGLEERMRVWLDMHATQRKVVDWTRPLLEGTAKLENGDIIHLEATPQPPAGVAERKVEARAKVPYVD